MQNISGIRSTSGDGETVAPDRQALQHELLEEMTAWSPRDREGAFKSWHRHALSLVHLTVLTTLELEGPLAMKRLAETLDVSDASATGIVDRMAKRGLVERKHGTDDRRVVLVHPTETGKTIFADMATRRRELLTRVIGELTADEMGALLVGMRAMHEARRRVLASVATTASGGPPGAPAGPAWAADTTDPPPVPHPLEVAGA
jgi:DNA-binding MarR family transcriptional regulator